MRTTRGKNNIFDLEEIRAPNSTDLGLETKVVGIGKVDGNSRLIGWHSNLINNRVIFLISQLYNQCCLVQHFMYQTQRNS